MSYSALLQQAASNATSELKFNSRSVRFSIMSYVWVRGSGLHLCSTACVLASQPMSPAYRLGIYVGLQLHLEAFCQIGDPLFTVHVAGSHPTTALPAPLARYMLRSLYPPTPPPATPTRNPLAGAPQCMARVAWCPAASP
jgi:hypothetical protein